MIVSSRFQFPSNGMTSFFLTAVKAPLMSIRRDQWYLVCVRENKGFIGVSEGYRLQGGSGVRLLSFAGFLLASCLLGELEGL